MRAINIAREKGAKVLSITSSAASPLAKFSDLALITGTTNLTVDNFSNESKVVQLFLIEALCTCLAFTAKEKSAAYQEQIDRLWDEYYSK
ncbi:MAG: MurR/RpiR family transcriptional regulator [Clostridia bacterium]|nr:MurR/RpiR family transcriptional regulator [Clostridia bacterium]